MEAIGKIIDGFFDEGEGKKIIEQEIKTENTEVEMIKHMIEYIATDEQKRKKELAIIYLKSLIQYSKNEEYKDLIEREFKKYNSE